MAVGAFAAGQGRTIITNSGAVTTSSATPNIGLAANAALYGGGIPINSAVDLILNVTANSGTGGANTAFVELQTSPDGGTTWFCAARFAQVTSSSTAIRLSMRTTGLGYNEAAAQTVSINTGTAAVIQNCVITKDQRVVWTLGNVGQSLTFGLYAMCMPFGARGE